MCHVCLLEFSALIYIGQACRLQHPVPYAQESWAIIGSLVEPTRCSLVRHRAKCARGLSAHWQRIRAARLHPLCRCAKCAGDICWFSRTFKLADAEVMVALIALIYAVGVPEYWALIGGVFV